MASNLSSGHLAITSRAVWKMCCMILLSDLSECRGGVIAAPWCLADGLGEICQAGGQIIEVN
jgi:hypothetical protein